VKAINELRVQLSTNHTFSAVNQNRRTFNTNIAEIQAKSFCKNLGPEKQYAPLEPRLLDGTMSATVQQRVCLTRKSALFCKRKGNFFPESGNT
jgi:hypothetical protein